MKKILAIVYFNIGVNVLGLPCIWVHKATKETVKSNSKFFKKTTSKITYSQFQA